MLSDIDVFFECLELFLNLFHFFIQSILSHLVDFRVGLLKERDVIGLEDVSVQYARKLLQLISHGSDACREGFGVALQTLPRHLLDLLAVDLPQEDRTQQTCQRFSYCFGPQYNTSFHVTLELPVTHHEHFTVEGFTHIRVLEEMFISDHLFVSLASTISFFYHICAG